MDIPTDVNPATGRLAAFDAAVRLGCAGKLFAVAVESCGTSSPVHLAARTDENEWSYVMTIGNDGLGLDWFTDVGPTGGAYVSLGARVVSIRDVINLPCATSDP